MKVSVVIAVYNSERHIRPCLEELRGQTFTDFETVLVVDSRSTDSSVDAALSLVSDYPDTRVIVQDDDGRAGGARNLGMDSASGEYIWFLDVDDHFSPSFLEEMVALAEDNDADVAVCNFYYSREDRFIVPPEKRYQISLQDSYRALIELNTGRYSTNLFNKLIRSDLIRDNGIRMSPRYCEDYKFLRDCFEVDCTVAYCNKPLYTYVLSEGTRSSGEGNRIAEEDIRIFSEMIDWAKQSGVNGIRGLYSSGLTHVLRSLTNADEECYRRCIDTDIVREASMMSGWSSKEIILFRISKRLFYSLGTKKRRSKFSKDVFLFDTDI